ncbi:glutamine synthetase family protein [Motiliproteus sp. MSK22-1]|uniref:glutamine synthetase family protein n=1 Tax=Motiliproteus sp. MSK22-1 TaxID=1897630 RepID=UPI0009769875|nr:glutamine synthetase family protein [Motiliproteus sp. MSK22-1]OMH38908.1 gamma-glutamylputrescine synthetase [Motiliproteus sp. MSK22-1]
MSAIAKNTEAIDFLAQNPSVEAIDLLICDLNGITRGKRIERESLLKSYEDGISIPASLFSLDITGKTVEACGLGLKIGEPDRFCLPQSNHLKVAPWQQRPMAQTLLSMYEADGSPFFGDPRHILTSVLSHFKAMKLTPVVAVELEFYLIDRQRNKSNQPQPPLSPKTGKREQHTQVYATNVLDEYNDFLEEIAKTTAEQGIPADAAVAEYAPGQFEINLKHQDDPLAACDNAILLKRVIKAVAERHGMEASFMAKPYEEEAGSGLHVHVSIIDEQGNNILAEPGQPYSKLMEYAVGGLLQQMPASMGLFCPNVNSFRRLRPEYYVPMSPNWGLDNRTVSVRIPASTDAAKRIEHRVAGADANPYLVMAAILASIHYGISEKIQPRPRTEGNAFEQDGVGLPTRLFEALEILKQNEILRSYLSSEFIDLYVTCKEEELSEFERHISQLESQWYLTTV